MGRQRWRLKLFPPTFDPLGHVMFPRSWGGWYTSWAFEVWQHVKYNWLGGKVKGVWLVEELVWCKCGTTHRRIVVRSAHPKQAEAIARTANLGCKGSWMVSPAFEPTKMALTMGEWLTGKHEGTALPEYKVKEFLDIEKAGEYVMEQTKERRKMEHKSGPPGGLPFGFGDGPRDYDDEEVSLQDVGGAYIMKRKTTSRKPAYHGRILRDDNN